MEPTLFNTDWTGRRVFVTGCTGFLGTWVVRDLLDAGAEVIGLVRDQVRDGDFLRERLYERMQVIRGRIEDGFRLRQAFAIHEIEVVFHLAGPPADAPNRAVLLALWFENIRSAIAATVPDATLVVPVRGAGRQPQSQPRTLLVPILPRTPGPIAAQQLIQAAASAFTGSTERSAA